MCGIVGYAGSRPAVDVVVGGLKRLEYRGYDSAGIAIQQNGTIASIKRQGKIQALVDAVDLETMAGRCGIAHTRWATHGEPNEINAHPHIDGKIVLVHNGIVENFQALKHRAADMFCEVELSKSCVLEALTALDEVLDAVSA